MKVVVTRTCFFGGRLVYEGETLVLAEEKQFNGECMNKASESKSAPVKEEKPKAKSAAKKVEKKKSVI